MALTRKRDLPRGEQHTMRLPCVGCQRPLPLPPWSLTLEGTRGPFVLDDVAGCECGIRYSGELLRTAHPESWAYIMHKRLICFDCGSPTVPVVYSDEHGSPIACPKHGPAPIRVSERA